MKKLTILALAALALAGVNGPDFPEQDGIVRDHTLHAHLTHSRAPLRHTPWGSTPPEKWTPKIGQCGK